MLKIGIKMISGIRRANYLHRPRGALPSTLFRHTSSLTPAEAGQKARNLAESKKEGGNVPIETILPHAGVMDVHNAPLAPPLHTATTYTRPPDGIYLENDYKYSRTDNPTRLLLEETIFKLEWPGTMPTGTVENVKSSSFAFSSGMMAATSVILAHNSPITVLLPKDLYHGVPTVLQNVFSRHNVATKQVDMSDALEVETSILGVDENHDVILWLESPSNPLCQVLDIEGLCTVAKHVTSRNVTTVVDATMSSPILMTPLTMGADISLHSGTKYLGGHSDALLGVATTNPSTKKGVQLTPLLKSVQTDAGGVASAFDSWLVLRGLRSLHVRVRKQCETAQLVAEFLTAHDVIVYYPGLVTHPNHTVAAKQMNGGFGGVLSVELENEAAATAFAAALMTIKRATSLGGTETLIEHRASIEPPGRVTSPPGLLRMSVGLEHAEDLIDDISRALDITKEVMSE